MIGTGKGISVCRLSECGREVGANTSDLLRSKDLKSVAIYLAFLYNEEALLLDVFKRIPVEFLQNRQDTVDSGSTANPSWSGVEV